MWNLFIDLYEESSAPLIFIEVPPFIKKKQKTNFSFIKGEGGAKRRKRIPHTDSLEKFCSCLFFSLTIFLLLPQEVFAKEQNKDLLNLEPVNVRHLQKNQANTSQVQFTKTELVEHINTVLKNEEQSIYPRELINTSLTQSVYSKLPSLIMIFSSQNQQNRKATKDFINLWSNHKSKLNFIFIDTQGQVNYYATLLLKEYWKDEDLKVIALDSSGKIRIQLEDPKDLPRLNKDLKILEAKDPNGFND